MELAGDDRKALLLDGVRMRGRDMPARWQVQIERQHAAIGVRAALAYDNPLAAGRIVDDMSASQPRALVSHAVNPTRPTATVPTQSCRRFVA